MVKNVSRLDYFVAHAPAQIPEWFNPVMETKCPKSRYIGSKSSEHPGEVFEDAFSSAAKCGLYGYEDANEEAVNNWNAERCRQKYIQWPLAWARIMIEEIAKYQ